MGQEVAWSHLAQIWVSSPNADLKVQYLEERQHLARDGEVVEEGTRAQGFINRISALTGWWW